MCLCEGGVAEKPRGGRNEFVCFRFALVFRGVPLAEQIASSRHSGFLFFLPFFPFFSLPDVTSAAENEAECSGPMNRPVFQRGCLVAVGHCCLDGTDVARPPPSLCHPWACSRLGHMIPSFRNSTLASAFFSVPAKPR